MIDTEALRKKIIDYAIQGKLTQQLPEDGNAEDLYVKIQEEKDKLLKEGKIKKEKTLPEISDVEIPFEIPSNWKWIRFGEATFIERGGSPRPIKNYITDADEGINWIKIGDVEKGGKYIYKTKEKIIPEGEKKSRHVYPGDFLLTNSMSFGRPYISMVEGCIHDGWLLIRDLHGFSADFLYYLLSSSYLYGQFCSKASGATVNNLNIDKVNTALIPLPPLEEQRRIVDILDKAFALFTAIDNLQKKYESNLEILNGKIIDAGIRGELTEQLPEDGNAEELYTQIQEEKTKLIKEGKIKKEKALPEISDDEIPFEIPQNWKWVRLYDLVTVLGDGLHGTPSYDEEGEFYFINGNNLQDGKIVIRFNTKRINEKESEKYRKDFSDKTILISINGTLGNIAFYNNEKVVLGKSACFINLLMKDVKYYLFYILKSSYFISYANYSATGVTIKNVSLKAMKEFCIPLPPLPEQKRISLKISELLKLLT